MHKACQQFSFLQAPLCFHRYLYNAVHRYYLDTKTGMYYGGDPAAWTNKPKIPVEASYEPEPSRDQGAVQTAAALVAATSLIRT